jgi:hypothetical protein
MSYVRACRLAKVIKAKDKRENENNDKKLKNLLKRALLQEDYCSCIGYKYQ